MLSGVLVIWDIFVLELIEYIEELREADNTLFHMLFKLGSGWVNLECPERDIASEMLFR